MILTLLTRRCPRASRRKNPSAENHTTIKQSSWAMSKGWSDSIKVYLLRTSSLKISGFVSIVTSMYKCSPSISIYCIQNNPELSTLHKYSWVHNNRVDTEAKNMNFPRCTVLFGSYRRLLLSKKTCIVEKFSTYTIIRDTRLFGTQE